MEDGQTLPLSPEGTERTRDSPATTRRSTAPFGAIGRTGWAVP